MSAIKIQNEPQRRRRSSQRGLLMQPRPDLPVLSDGETQLVVRLRDRTHEANGAPSKLQHMSLKQGCSNDQVMACVRAFYRFGADTMHFQRTV